LRGLQSSILLVLCIPFANCAKRKLPVVIENSNVLTTEAMKMSLQVLGG